MNQINAVRLVRYEEEAAGIVGQLRGQSLARKEAFQAFIDFRQKNPASGLGPAFFTKLIFFAHPKHDGYIMDQHVGRAVNLLFGGTIVKFRGPNVGDHNDAENYEHFCKAIEVLRDFMTGDDRDSKGMTGEEVEMLLFAPNEGKTRSKWRAYIEEHAG